MCCVEPVHDEYSYGKKIYIYLVYSTVFGKFAILLFKYFNLIFCLGVQYFIPFEWIHRGL